MRKKQTDTQKKSQKMIEEKNPSIKNDALKFRLSFLIY